MKNFCFLFIVMCLSLSAAEREMVIHELNAEQLEASRYTEPPQQTFAFNGKNIQIKNAPAHLNAVWYGHAIKPSEANVITLRHKALDDRPVQLRLQLTIYYCHTTPADRCNGRAAPKGFSQKVSVGRNAEEAVLKVPVTESDLRCTQCGKVLDHGVFLFDISLEGPGHVEITPPTVKTTFAIQISGARDKHSEYLSNILSPDYQPYEQKKLPPHPMLSRDVRTISEDAMKIFRDLEEFRPIMELYQQENYRQAVAEAEKLSEQNTLAQIVLYLVYSRGYNGIDIDYRKAAACLSKLIGSFDGREPGFMFYSYEYRNIWKKYRLPPTVPGEKAVVTAWGVGDTIIQEIIPLRGKYPLKNCYEEKMRNIGGVIPRALYLLARENQALSDLRDEARRAGCAEAWAGNFAPFERRIFTPNHLSLAEDSGGPPSRERLAELQHAADLGYVPAKLIVARRLVAPQHMTEDSIKKARTLLQDAIRECRSYSDTPCMHAQADLQFATELLAFIPDEETGTAELLARYRKANAGGNDFYSASLQLQRDILAFMLARRDDSPECLYFRALALPQNERLPAMKEAADKGSAHAVHYYLYQGPGNTPDRWYYCYLAGKHELPHPELSKKYFDEAYRYLKERQYSLPPAQYKEHIALLAPYHPLAKEESQRLSAALEFEITCSDDTSLKAELVNEGGRYYLQINADPSGETRHIIFRKSSPKQWRVSVVFFTHSRECNPRDLFCEFTDEKNQLRKVSVGPVPAMRSIPQEMKLTIAPRQTPLDLKIAFHIIGEAGKQ